MSKVLEEIISERERKLVVKKFHKASMLKQILDLEIEIESDEKDLEYFRKKLEEEV